MPNNIAIAKLQDKSVSVTSNGSHTISPDQGYTGLHKVSLDVDVAAPGLIKFYDYDGTLVTSYTGEEVQVLSALPSAPDHSQDEVPLTFDEWNWSLADIKAYNTSYPTTDINVGACYHPTDNKNHFYFNITSNTDGNGVYIELHEYSQGDTVDWGDGSAIEIISSIYLNHIYTSTGEYHCIIDSTSICYTCGSDAYLNTCSKLTKVYLSNITRLPDSAFENCYSLELINIPKGVTFLGNNVFKNCNNLKSLTIPNGPNGIISIGDYVFQLCSNLKSVTLPESGINRIGTSAFQSCYSLQSITISVGTGVIGTSAFQSCPLLSSVTIPSNVTLQDYTFRYCYNLQSVIISSGVTSIGAYAFNGCYNLKSISIPDTVNVIGEKAFLYCYSLQSVTIPSSVTSIGTNAFQNCYSLQSITLPNLTSMGNEVFYTCKALRLIDNVCKVSDRAFSNCYSIQSITIQSTVTAIGVQAFENCYSLYSITLLPTSPPMLSNTNSFSTTYLKKFYVPYSEDHSILNAYKTAANWSNYANYMEELPQS